MKAWRTTITRRQCDDISRWYRCHESLFLSCLFSFAFLSNFFFFVLDMQFWNDWMISSVSFCVRWHPLIYCISTPP